MAKKQQTDDNAPIGDGIENDPAPPPPPEPEKITTIEDHGIGAADPYPTGKPATPEVK
jgi:hypothetical protein